MAFDLKDQFKEHKKILVPGAGVLILALIIGFMYSSGMNPFNIQTDITGDGLDTVLDTKVTGKSYSSAPVMQLKQNVDYQAVIKTDYGNITVDLFEKDTPITVNNFVFLSKDKFYDNLKFHRIIKGFVLQGGDPKGDGTGGPGYQFQDEIDADALGLNDLLVKDATYLRSFYSSSVISQYSNSSVKAFYEKVGGYKYTPGYGTNKFAPYVLAMANSGPDTNGSQFFITVKTFTANYLDGKHTIFGRVVGGFDVVDSIEQVNVKNASTPTTPVVIKSIQIVEK